MRSTDGPVRRVCLLGTGGTIASTHDLSSGASVAALDSKALLRSVGDLPPDVVICPHTVAVHNSWMATPAWMRELAHRILEAAADHNPDGIVVTHGTDTLEETAFVLDGLLRTTVPVVLTGAMRGADDPSADGPMNLRAAIHLAVSGGERAPVRVTFAGEVFDALEIRKWHATADDAFRAVKVAVDDVSISGDEPRPLRTPALPDVAPSEDVVLIRSVSGGCAPLLAAARAIGVRALVVEGFGAGNVYAADHDELDRFIADGAVVVLATRCSDGRVVPTYGRRGGGVELIASGLIPTGRLSGIQARLALAFLIADGADAAAIASWFATADAQQDQKAVRLHTPG